MQHASSLSWSRKATLTRCGAPRAKITPRDRARNAPQRVGSAEMQTGQERQPKLLPRVAVNCCCQMLLPNAQLLPNVVAKRTNFNGNCEELENACAGRDEVHKKEEPALDAVALLSHVVLVLFNILYPIF